MEVGTCTASRPSTPEGGELRQEIAALRLMARQGQGANEELREVVAKLSTQVKNLTLQVNHLARSQESDKKTVRNARFQTDSLELEDILADHNLSTKMTT